MAIISSELHWYQSATVNDTTSNGGLCSYNRLVTGQTNSWWPNITDAQLTSGATQYRKSFLRIDNANDDIGYNLRVGLWKPTPGDDQLYLIAGTQSDIQSAISGSLYGAGQLNASVLAEATEITVAVDDGTVIIFRDGEKIRISDQTTAGDPDTGHAEVCTISGTPTIDGDVVTITLAAGLTYGYSNTNTYVCSLIEQATVTGVVSNKVVTSAGGTFDETKVSVGNLGSIYQDVTLTFTSATAFTVTSNRVTFSPSSGTVSSTFAPTNTNVGAAYFSIPSTAFGGTFTTGNTVAFRTTPPSLPIWEKRIVPSGSSAFALQTVTIMAFVDS